MKHICKALIILWLVTAFLTVVACSQKNAQTGLLQGGVTIGPITPVEIPGQNPIVPPEVFSSRKVMVYDSTGKNLVTQVVIHQIKETANGYYSVQLAAGIYAVSASPSGIGGTTLPVTVSISAGQTTILDIDIDTGIR